MIEPVIYLDYNSTTPVDARVLEEMLPYFTRYYGNASSKTHRYGWEAAEAVEIARRKVADLLSADSSEIVFTSGSTEAINIALHGLALNYGDRKKNIITCGTEHKAVLETLASLSEQGFSITQLNVSRDGTIDLQELKTHLNDTTLCVCLMMANNETGVIHPIEEIGALCHEKNVFLFTDATQAAGKMRIDVNEMHIDILCISAHKFYGPKGTGALFIRRKNPSVKLAPWITGGGHERGLRPGTLNVPAIVGFGKACEVSTELFWEEVSRLSSMRTRFEQLIEQQINITINGSIRNRLPNTTNICFNGIEAARLIRELPTLAFSTGSACTSALPEPSHVLKSMGLTDKEIFSSVRFSIGRMTTMEEADAAVQKIISAINKLKV
ncbi:MAG: cysteine desulfurase family protein [Bacteroidota bacterium]